MTDAELIEALGGASTVANAIGAGNPQTVSNWKSPKRRIPPEWRPHMLALARAQGLSLDEDAFLGVPRLPAESADPTALAAA